MRGQRRTLAAVLAQTLAGHPGARAAAVAAAFAEACGPRLAREASFRGVLADGRLLVVVRSSAWAAQLEPLAGEICGRVNARLGRAAAAGLSVHVAAPER